MTLFAVGLNHRSAPLEVREKVALPEGAVGGALADLRRETALAQAVIVSTCNRLEIYAAAARRDGGDAVAAWLCNYRGLDAGELEGHLFTLHDTAAARHLLRVASGLESVIVGEPQVLGQVKSAYRASLEGGHSGELLGRLFEHAISTAKRARSETGLGRHPVSYASVAVDVSRKIFDDLSTKHALMIGAGDMIELTMRHLKSHGIGSLAVANRSPENARRLAAEHGAETVDFGGINDALPRYDIVVSSTAGAGIIVGRAAIERALKTRKRRPVCIVDLALPRDIDPAAAELEDVYLYTLDNLAEIAGVNRRNRLHEADKAGRIVEEHLAGFIRWLNTRQAGDLVRRLRALAEGHRDDALHKALQLLNQGKSPDEALRHLAHALTGKLTHHPTDIINKAAGDNDRALLEAAKKLFDLGGDDGDKP